MPTNKSLIVLQENSGQVPFDPSIPPAVRQQITFWIDELAVNSKPMWRKL